MSSIRCALVALAVVSHVAQGQLVSPRTVPVHQGDQFDVLPSSRAGMAGVWIALDDTLLDPFINPAKSTRLTSSAFFALPYAHFVSGDRGGGRSVPVGGYFAGARWSGAGMVAVQQLNRSRVGVGAPLSERSAVNQYATASLARRLGNGVSLGGAVFVAALGAIDGVDLLYAGSDTIRQDGHVADMRLGLTKSWEGGRTFEAILLHNRTSMEHDVHTTTFGWDSTRRTWGPRSARWDLNADRTHIWGVHSEYVRPFGTEGWRVGWLATANRISHPKIPNYRIMNIPRDPGFTNAFNVGVGFGRTIGATAFGFDIIHEPIFSNTWADAATDTTGPGGRIAAGGKTVENNFRFANQLMRFGVSRERRRGRDSTVVSGFQFGLAVANVNYRLKQRNNVLGTNRVQAESWLEWVPTFGYRYRARDIEFMYNMRLSCFSGSSCVEFASGDDVSVTPAAPVDPGIIAAPAAPLTFDGGRAIVHRFLITIPLR